jgi:hypothetical protein
MRAFEDSMKTLNQIIALMLIPCLLDDPALAAAINSPVTSVSVSGNMAPFAQEAFASRADCFPPTLGSYAKITFNVLVERGLKLWRAKPAWWPIGAPSPAAIVSGIIAGHFHPAGGMVAMVPSGDETAIAKLMRETFRNTKGTKGNPPTSKLLELYSSSAGRC